MKTIQTIVKKRTLAVVGFMLAVMLVVSGLLSVQNSPTRMVAAAVMESANTPAEIVTDSVKANADSVALPAPVTENRVTEEAEKAAAAAKTKSLGSGEASFYGPGFAGRPTANGERFNPAEMTAAHRTLPFGSKLRVTNMRNGQSVVVRVNDRGPYAHNRVIDLSQGAAKRIGMINSGTANVKLELIS